MKLNPKSPLAEAIREFELKPANGVPDTATEDGVILVPQSTSETVGRFVGATMDYSQKTRTISVGSYLVPHQ